MKAEDSKRKEEEEALICFLKRDAEVPNLEGDGCYGRREGEALQALLRPADSSFSVVGDVNRLNAYGNQSECVQKPMLRKYCFCVAL